MSKLLSNIKPGWLHVAQRCTAENPCSIYGYEIIDCNEQGIEPGTLVVIHQGFPMVSFGSVWGEFLVQKEAVLAVIQPPTNSKGWV